MAKLRVRTRIQSSPPPGEKQEWDEWQIYDGRNIIKRFGTESEARKFAEKYKIPISN